MSGGACRGRAGVEKTDVSGDNIQDSLSIQQGSNLCKRYGEASGNRGRLPEGPKLRL